MEKSYSRGKYMEFKSLVDVPEINLNIDFKIFSENQQYNLSSASQIPKFKQISATQEKGLHEPNFITLGKISWTNYYESTQEYSLFQLKS